jgi:RNA recognition motif-containing protein
MYEHALDAETALQQLPLHGLTTSWAKESFSTKLRKLSDNSSTNVYVSNLPLDMTPHQLEQLFTPHVVVSLRILLDDNGDSRGVGFVRLRDRDTAQECIDKLHGKVLSGQSTPLQARFADSEAQKRLKQSVNQPSAVVSQKPASIPKSNTGILDSALADSMYLASLQGVHNWAGFSTPQATSNASFPVMSPQLSMTSPAMNYAQWSPNMAANAAANWNLLASDAYANSLLANSATYGLNYANSIYSPSTIATSMNSPFAQMSNKSLSPLSFTSTPLSGNSPMMGGKGDLSNRLGSARSKPTYLPPDVHQQHAKALLEAQAGLAFDSPQAEAFGLSQLLLANSTETGGKRDFSPYSSAHSYMPHANTESMGNALRMSGMIPSRETLTPSTSTKSLPSQSTKSSTIPLPSVVDCGTDNASGEGKTDCSLAAQASLLPIRFSLGKDQEKPIVMEALTKESGEEGKDEDKQPIRTPTPMPVAISDKTCASASATVQESVTEEGDSLVFDSGTASTVGKFSLPRVEAKEEVVTLTKSDSGKVLDQNCQVKAQEVDQEAPHTSEAPQCIPETA